ncbi:hypothetical protein ASF22_21600 [Methylobacterium sp. Leaf87]|nr:hypothetical protein ASF22_21600 [Methylobacterium sp. Leaf87]
MVIAHALFAPLDEMQNFRSLNRLIAKLASSAELIADPMAFVLEDGDEGDNGSDLQAVAALLVGRGKKPVVWLGPDRIEPMLIALWRNLWPSMRRDFAFRLSFGPDDIVDPPTPALVCTPVSLAVRWRGYPIIEQSSAPNSVAARVLSGVDDAEPLRAFAASIGHVDTTLQSLPRLVEARRLLQSGADLTELAAGLRLINLLSPDPAQGRGAKAGFVDATASVVASSSAEQVMLLRNLSLEGFNDLKALWVAVTKWMAFYPINSREPALLATIVASNRPSEAIQEWRSAILAGGGAIEGARLKQFAEAFWAWLEADDKALPALLALTPVGKSAEEALIAALPKRLIRYSTDLLPAFVDRRWLSLHGAVLARSTGAVEAVREQLKVDKDPKFSAGILAAIASAASDDLLKIASSHDDARLDTIAGREIIGNFSLAAKLDFALPSIQRIWVAALAIDTASWQAPADPLAVRRAILDALLNGSAIHSPLIAAFAATPLADLSDFERRGMLWPQLEDAQPFLDATARGWLMKTAAGNAEALDSRLEQAVLQSAYLNPQLGQGWGEALATIAALRGLGEERTLTWFSNLAARASPPDSQQAELLGRIILDRNWSRLLNSVRERSYDIPVLKATLQVCASMFSPLSRWMMGLSEVDTEEKWRSFADLAADLYPKGPDDRDIWERAGGSNSDILARSTGSERWRHAIRLVRRGDGPVVISLLREMQKDFKSNPNLQFIAKDRDITEARGRSRGFWPFL